MVTQINADIQMCKQTLNKLLCSDVKETIVIICMNVTWCGVGGWGGGVGGGGLSSCYIECNPSLFVLK